MVATIKNRTNISQFCEILWDISTQSEKTDTSKWIISNIWYYNAFQESDKMLVNTNNGVYKVYDKKYKFVSKKTEFSQVSAFTTEW